MTVRYGVFQFARYFEGPSVCKQEGKHGVPNRTQLCDKSSRFYRISCYDK